MYEMWLADRLDDDTLRHIGACLAQIIHVVEPIRRQEEWIDRPRMAVAHINQAEDPADADPPELIGVRRKTSERWHRRRH